MATSDGVVLYTNETALELVGGMPQHGEGPLTVADLLVPVAGAAAVLPAAHARLRGAIAEGIVETGVELECRGPFGAPRRLLVDVEPVASLDLARSAVTLSLIDPEASRWHQAALKTLMESSRILVRSAGEQELLDGICELIVRDGSFRLAWIGFARADDAHSVEIRAVAGVDGYVEPGFVTWTAGDPRGDGPTGRSLRTGVSQTCNDTANDPTFLPWRENALAHGLRSTITFPFAITGDLRGMLAVYAPEPNGFDQRMSELLGMLADSLGYGIRSLRALEERSAAAARFETLLDAPGLLALVTAPGGELLHQSTALTALVGGRDFVLDDVHPDDRAAALASWEAAVAAGAEVSGDARVLDAAGAERQLVATTVPYIEPQDESRGFVTVFGDVTSRLREEQQVAAAARIDAIAGLAAGVAHDVKNLLLAMVASAAALGSATTPEGQEISAALEAAGRDANALLRRLVALGAEPAGPPRPIDLNEIVADVRDLVAASLDRRCQLVVRPAPGPVVAVADAIAVRRALVNLVTNAADAIGGPGTIVLDVLPADGASGLVGVVVSDSGPGIAPDDLERIWEPFFTTKSEGTGLGLPAARAVALAAGGELTVTSRPGEGATFTLRLPAAGGAA